MNQNKTIIYSASLLKLFIFILILFTDKTQCQSDSIACIKTHTNENLTNRNHILSLETIYTIKPLLRGGFGAGFSYERNLTGRKSFILTGKMKRKHVESSEEIITANTIYFQIGVRYYFSKTIVKQKTGNSQILILKTKNPNQSSNRAAYIGPILVGNFHDFHGKEFDPLIETLLFDKHVSINSLGLGVCLGYQLYIKNKFVVNFDLPIGIIHSFYNRNWEIENHQSNDSYTEMFSRFNVNFGLTF